MDSKLLVRSKDTLPMKTLSKQQRYENLKKAFIVNKKRQKYKRVLIVDDIFTTGSTLDACARVLRKNGVEVVYGMCISSGS
jgi:predicted amidophosphoribosyltransferase